MSGGVVQVIVALTFVTAACAPTRIPPPSPPRTSSLALKVAGQTLDNGLRVVVVEDPAATDIHVTMRYPVGASADPVGQEGVAHLVEHLMFQQVLGAESVFAHLQEHATAFNAQTSADATTYEVRAAPERLDELLSIEAVRAGSRCAGLSDATFERERAVVVDELKESRVPSAVMGAIASAVYPAGHAFQRIYADSPASVAAITKAQACAFADAHYAPNAAALVVSGKVTEAEVTAALAKFLARVPRRAVVPGVPIPSVAATARRVDVTAPIGGSALVLAWPLSTDPRTRAQMRAIAPMITRLIDGEIRGQVIAFVVGGDAAPMQTWLIVPATGETVEEALAGARRGVSLAPRTLRARGPLAEFAHDEVQQTAIFTEFAELDDAATRDAALAGDVLAGQDPATVVGEELRGLRELSRAEAARTAEAHFDAAAATVVTFTGHAGAGAERPTDLVAAVHDLGLRRDLPDPAAAHAPMSGAAPAATLAGMTTRTLPNGLRVVLIPTSSVPAVDVRLVFAAGTGDEPATARGVGIFAAATLDWDVRYLNDLIAASAAGSEASQLGFDQTVFVAQGLDMHVDLMLAGLRRWVREGQYDLTPAGILARTRADAKRSDDAGAVTDAWRAALYGPSHPYATAGLLRRATPTLTPADTDRFRAARYTPDNATLVIAGRFDAALADRWIDFLFDDWTGHAVARAAPAAAPTAAVVATDEPSELVRLTLAMPAVHGGRAEQLVAAAMLRLIADDVRQQLGASYGLAAALDEARLANDYVVTGAVDAPRAGDALTLIRDRIAGLRTDPTGAARLFVLARARVYQDLEALRGDGRALAAVVADDVGRGRPPLADLETAIAVHGLTIDGMGPALGDLDLAAAAMSLRGPRAQIDAAVAVLGRAATYVTGAAPVAPAAAAGASAVTTRIAHDPVGLSDLEPLITAPYTPPAAYVTTGVGYALGHFGEHDTSGVVATADVGVRIDERTAVGVHTALGVADGAPLTGRFPTGTPNPSLTVVPVDIGVAVRTVADRVWGGAFLGLHLDQSSLDGWHAGIGGGLEAGFDLLRPGANRLGVFGLVQTELASDQGYFALSFGLAYRR